VNAQLPAGGSPIAGRYLLGRTLGAGAAAVVYAGRDLRTNARVAIKIYRNDGTAVRVQQQRELEALAQLDHPGLVTLHDEGREPRPDGRTYIVTDLVEGPTLATRIQRGPLQVGEIRALGAALAAALAHVHERGFVHRDVKPANILLDHGWEPRLADFGIARALDGTVATAAGAVTGTAAYLAPEQVRGETVGPPADVYALGLVLIEARTGRREYPGAMVESATARLFRRSCHPGCRATSPRCWSR
jgi:serine/threonine protein kinase